MTARAQQHTPYGPIRTRRPWLVRLTLIIVSILILSNLIAALLAAGYQIYYDGLVYPGVSVWGVDLSGKTPAEAAAELNGQFTYPQSTVITFRDNENVWPVTAQDLGIGFDIERTVQAAYEVGRHPQIIPAIRQQVQAWRNGIVVSPVIVYDQPAAESHLLHIAGAIDRPAFDATITIAGQGVQTTPGQVGRQVDVTATLAGLNDVILDLETGEIPVRVVEHQPEILSAENAAAEIRAILDSDLEVYIADPSEEDPGPWVATRDAVAQMILIERLATEDGTGAYYDVRLHEGQLKAFLDGIAPELDREPADARFLFNDDTRQIEVIRESLVGRSLNIPATIQLINQQAPTTDHRVPLVFNTVEPQVASSSTAAELGIIELVSSATTYYYGSTTARRTNITEAASRFNGVVITPGQEFSFNEYLGDVSLDSGFEASMIIFNGRTIEGVGGGVCQVSTTAFQAAFYAGFPITERWPHGYWVGYYDSGEGKGMDATVYSPLVDIKFVNDTTSHLLIETFADPASSTITFRYYSTSDGRTVEKGGPVITNRVPHGPPLYEESADIAPGQVEQVDYAIDGFDVTISRTVYRDGGVLYEDTFYSQYVPWQAIYQVAPGYVPPGADTVGY